MANEDKQSRTSKTVLLGPSSSMNTERLYTLSCTEGRGKISFCLSTHRKGRLPHVRTLSTENLEALLTQLKGQQNSMHVELETAKKALIEGKGKGPSELGEIVIAIETFQGGKG